MVGTLAPMPPKKGEKTVTVRVRERTAKRARRLAPHFDKEVPEFLSDLLDELFDGLEKQMLDDIAKELPNETDSPLKRKK